MTGTYVRPDVYLNESLLTTSPVFFPPTSIGAFVGESLQGPTDPTYLQGWPAYQRLYGGFSTTGANTLAAAVYSFFSNGGGACWVSRVIGSGATNATVTLVSRDSGTPATLVVTSLNPGVWGNSVTVEISDVNGVTGRFNLIVRVSGRVESWNDVTMDPNSPRNVLNLVNSPVSGSSYISLSLPDGWDYTGTATTPAVSNTPGVGVALSSGADESAPPTLGSSGQWLAAVNALDVVNSPFVMNLVGVTDAATINAAISWCEAKRQAFLVIDPQFNRSASQAVSDAQAFSGSSYAATYWPPFYISDPAATQGSANRLISPSGAVVGVFTFVDRNRGVHRAPAGAPLTRLNGIVALESQTSLTDYSTLAAGGASGVKVNGIRPISGLGFCVWGARTLKPNESDSYIPIRRSLVAIEDAILTVLTPLVFEPNDQFLWSQVRAQVDRICREFWQQGGLKGNTPQEAYFVTCDETNNSETAVDNGEVFVDVGLALQRPAEFIIVNIGQYNGGANTSVSETIPSLVGGA